MSYTAVLPQSANRKKTSSYKEDVKRGWQNREVWRHVIMVALFLDDNKTNDDGDGKENGKKYTFILRKNNFARASRYFVHFFAVVASLRHKTS